MSSHSQLSSACSHPVGHRMEEDDGGDVCSPSFYCTRCKRFVIDYDPSSYSAPHPTRERAEAAHRSPQA